MGVSRKESEEDTQEREDRFWALRREGRFQEGAREREPLRDGMVDRA